MLRRHFYQLSLIASLALSVQAYAQPKELIRVKENNPWHGYPDGSWIELTETVTTGTETTKTHKRLILEEFRGEVGISEFVKKDGVYPTKWDRHYGPPGGRELRGASQIKELASRKAVITIDGKEHECSVTKFQYGGTNEVEINLWYLEGAKATPRLLHLEEDRPIALRPDVVRVDVVLKGDEVKETASSRVVSFKSKRKIGDREITCVKEEGEWSLKSKEIARNGKSTRWLSDDVPGRIIADEIKGEQKIKAGPTEKLEVLIETTAFQIAKSGK